MQVRVLLIDDDERLFELLDAFLGRNGVALAHALDGRAGLTALETGGYDAVLLDGMMPGLDGLEVLRRIRAGSSIPVLMLTARGDEADRVVGLELGADDFISKPFGVREVIARMRAVTRRLFKSRTPERRDPDVVQVGHLEVHPQELRAKMGDEVVDLSLRDVRILLLLHRERGRVVSREMLFNECWDMAYLPNSRTIDHHISKLRKRVELDPNNPTLITTVHGVGYRIE
jgi:DNA-binding response OmpR family regulator